VGLHKYLIFASPCAMLEGSAQISIYKAHTIIEPSAVIINLNIQRCNDAIILEYEIGSNKKALKQIPRLFIIMIVMIKLRS